MASGLATRCSACGTVFRVVADQLRVSEGWVRCGRCSQVFNALESLVDLDTGLPRREGLGLGGGASDAVLDVAEPAARPGAPPLPAPPPPAPPPAGTAPPMPQRARAVREGEFLSTAGPDSPEGQEARDSRLPPMDTLLSPTPAAPPSWGSGARPAASAPAPLSPSFVRQADRAAFWRRPAVRAGLLSLALLLSLLLAAQAAHTWRDRLAAQVPALEPALALGCEWLGCDIGPARALPALSVESSGLVRVERSNLYKLQVSLRNRAPHPVAVPALDLTLTDARGELVARRVILLTELGLAEATIPPGRDVPLQATLQSTAAADGTARVIAGYTVELFYP